MAALPLQKSIKLEEHITTREEVELSAMGYCPPAWDTFRLQKPFPTVSPTEDALLCTELTPQQSLLVKVWPKIESFFVEEEDVTVVLHAETVLKHVLGFERSSNRCTGYLRRKWACIDDTDEITELNPHVYYTRSFDSQAHSSKYKMNRATTRLLDNLQNEFLQSIRSLIAEAFAFKKAPEFVNNDQLNEFVYFKGKELEFEEDGNQIIWSISTRQIAPNLKSPRTWFVNPSETEIQHTEKPTENPPEDEKRKTETSTNPFQTNPFESSDNEEISDEPCASEQQEYQKQVVEQRIICFINEVWPQIRNFYLDLSIDALETPQPGTTAAPSCVIFRNGCPTKVLEFHYDALNERNRWKFLLEISADPRDKSNESQTKNHWAIAASRQHETSNNFIELRSYKMFEKRGTSSISGEDVNDNFKGLYKRWFLNELQWTLVYCYAHLEFNTLTLKQATFDPQLYDYGKDLQFSDPFFHFTWSFSAQKIPQYRKEDTPAQVWAYKLSYGYSPQKSSTLKPGVPSFWGSENLTDSEADTSSEQVCGVRQGRSVPDTRSKITKSRSSIKQMMEKTLRPVMRKFGGRGSIFGRKNVRPDADNNKLAEEDIASSRSTLNASAYLADGESVWSAAESRL